MISEVKLHGGDMRNKIIVLLLSLLVSCAALSWTHGISLGYGGGSDMNHHTDTNYGGFLAAEFLSLKQKSWLNITLGGSLGQFYSTTATNNNLFTGGLSFAFRFYPHEWSTRSHPFLLASVGPSYISSRHFGQNNQAANFAFQSILGLGVEFGQAKRVDMNVRFIHYSNAYTMSPNEGFNIFYVFSLGYLF